jgi:hypothetical protein
MSRPGAKAKMARIAGNSLVLDSGDVFKITEWDDLSNAAPAIRDVISKAGVVTDKKGRMWYLRIRKNGTFVLQVPTAGGQTIQGRMESSRPGAKAKFAEDAREVAQEILRQLGGGRFMAMVGGKNAFHGTFGGKAGLQFDIGKGADGGVNRVIVKLDRGTDTYDMEFWRIGNRGMNVKKVSEASGVYADDLQRIFTSRTKFYTSLSRPGAKAKFGITNAASAFLKKMLREYASMKGTRWYDEAKYISDNPTEHTDAEVIAAVGNLKLAKSVSSRPGAKAKYQKEYILWALPKGETDRLEERPIAEGIQTPKQMDEAKRKAAAAGWHGFRVQILDMSKPFRWMSRPGAKAKMGKWESTLTKKHGKTIEEYTARLKGGMFKIEVGEGSGGPYAILYRWDDLRGLERIASGNLQSLMRQAESMGAKEARGVAAVERLANYARPGAKAKMAKYRAFVYRGSPRSNVLVKATEWMDSASAAEDAAKQIAMSFRGKPGYNSNDYFADIAQETPEGAKTVKNNVRFSRPGAKAKMAYAPSESDMKKWMKGWTLRLPMVPDAGIRHFNSFEEAKRYGDAKCGGFSCEISYDGRRVASKGALSPEGSWTKHSRKGTKTGMRRMTQQETSHLKAWIGKNFRTTEEMMDAMTKMEKVFEEDSEHWESRSWPEVAKAAGVWSRPGAKAKMSKATDALDYIKSSIANGKTVYVQAGSRTTKITPQTYAKWEASGRPLFKMSSDGALLMASGSSYVRLTLADEMLARVSAMSRPGAKVRNAIREGEKVSASDDAVSRKIRKLMDEGKPQKQAVAIALDLERRGEL